MPSMYFLSLSLSQSHFGKHLCAVAAQPIAEIFIQRMPEWMHYACTVNTRTRSHISSHSVCFPQMQPCIECSNGKGRDPKESERARERGRKTKALEKRLKADKMEWNIQVNVAFAVATCFVWTNQSEKSIQALS